MSKLKFIAHRTTAHSDHDGLQCSCCELLDHGNASICRSARESDWLPCDLGCENISFPQAERENNWNIFKGSASLSKPHVSKIMKIAYTFESSKSRANCEARLKMRIELLMEMENLLACITKHRQYSMLQYCFWNRVRKELGNSFTLLLSVESLYTMKLGITGLRRWNISDNTIC